MPVKSKLVSKSVSLSAVTSEQSQNIDPRYNENSSNDLLSVQKKQLRHYHHNAHRTKINLILDRKNTQKTHSQKKKKRRVSYFLMAEQYKRKLSCGLDMSEEQQVQVKRKISWSQQSQYIAFNKNKSCQAIKNAPRHKFSIDQ